MNPSVTNCICCGAQDFKDHFKGLLRCISCGHIVANLDPQAINSKELYSIDYFEEGEYLNYVQDRRIFERNFQRRLRSIRKHQPDGQLLEIGAASGFFLNLARQYFQTTGYEICEDMANYARKQLGLNIKSTDFLTDHVPEDYFDMVVMWDVIEHLVHPESFIDKIYRSLKKGGYVALTTGDIGSPMAKLQGPSWRLIHPPTHVHYFTQGSISKFLVRRGFEVVDIQYPGYSRSIRQMVHGLLKDNKLWASIEKSSWAGWPVYLNLFDIMQVVARKI
jgi:cyclopropane fatty-acyl-phospholipid synthase-like methyltransferase